MRTFPCFYLAAGLIACLVPSATAEETATAGAGLFEAMPPVVAATLHAQTLDEAPANVTVITAEEIRRYGYRTLGEALSHVRGFYTSYDRMYTGAGVRGISLPGDYNTRFLVMINGHNMTENVYGSNNYFGQDFGLDLDLVERIEIIRGPTSTLYGSNGIFATINVVTRAAAERGSALSLEAGSYGQKKLSGSTAVDLGRGVNLLLAGSLYGARGQDLYFPEFDHPDTNFGRAIGVDGEDAYHTFANLVYGGWSLTGYFTSRRKSDPAAPYGTVFNRDSARAEDTRDFVELGYLKETGAGTWRWRLYYDRYLYEGFWEYEGEDGAIERTRDYALGSAVGTQLTYRRNLAGRLGALTAGIEASGELHAVQRYFEGQPEAAVLDLDTPDRGAAVFVQHEYPVGRRTTLTWGARLDGSLTRRGFLSPRLALIHRQARDATWKLLYGRAFRNASSYERYYADGVSQLSNPSLAPESGNTIEGVYERKLGQRLLFIASAYRYGLDRLITARAASGDLFQFVNHGGLSASGLELEMSGRCYRWLEAGVSAALQRFRDNRARTPPPNSPARLWKARLGAPVGRRLFASGQFRRTSGRYTLAGSRLDGYHLLDATLSTVRLTPRFDVVTGVRNLLGEVYADPVEFGGAVDTIRQDGRSFFVKLVWHVGE